MVVSNFGLGRKNFLLHKKFTDIAKNVCKCLLIWLKTYVIILRSHKMTRQEFTAPSKFMPLPRTSIKTSSVRSVVSKIGRETRWTPKEKKS